MSEKRFIELLNLYLDGEISSSEKEDLDREIAANSRRRATYLSYCRLQQASEKVYQEFGEELTETVDLKKYQILARSSTRCCLRRGLFYSAGALAAACLTVAAAVTAFQDAQQEPFVSAHSAENLAVVQVLDPEVLNVKRGSRSSPYRPETFTFAGRFLDRRAQETSFLPSPHPQFSLPLQTSWESSLTPASPSRVIWGDSPSVATPEFSSFEFQR